MYFKRFFSCLIILYIILSLHGCGFHLKNTLEYINFSEIKPKFEQDEFIAIAPTIGFYSDNSSKLKVNNLIIKPELIANEDTGNKWRQYEYNASWTLHYKHKSYQISAKELINLPSNQTPYQKLIISDKLNGLRLTLLNNTQQKISAINHSK